MRRWSRRRAPPVRLDRPSASSRCARRRAGPSPAAAPRRVRRRRRRRRHRGRRRPRCRGGRGGATAFAPSWTLYRRPSGLLSRPFKRTMRSPSDAAQILERNSYGRDRVSTPLGPRRGVGARVALPDVAEIRRGQMPRRGARAAAAARRGRGTDEAPRERRGRDENGPRRVLRRRGDGAHRTRRRRVVPGQRVPSTKTPSGRNEPPVRPISFGLSAPDVCSVGMQAYAR